MIKFLSIYVEVGRQLAGNGTSPENTDCLEYLNIKKY